MEGGYCAISSRIGPDRRDGMQSGYIIYERLWRCSAEDKVSSVSRDIGVSPARFMRNY